MQSAIEDSDGYYLNKGEQPSRTRTWQTFARILAAAKICE
jgi:hypothetical protein